MYFTLSFLRRAVFCALSSFVCLASAQQDAAPVKKAIDAWLKVQTRGLPGQVSWEIGGLDAGNQLAPCKQFDIGRPPGARTWGRTHLIVRCLDAGWRIYVPVHVRVKGDYLIAAKPIAQGQTISAEDLATQSGDLSELPPNILTDSALAIGKTASASIPAGRPLRADLLKTPLVIRQGQTVRIVSQGPGFAVSNEGRALTNAREGEIAQVRLVNGQVVSGTARADGSVEVGY
ncbi:MAG: flagellar basal body P-ring formation chaperone FlgA [Pseudomonadota bacterium]|nr:flagellar basal body P-ring formation chaperone FlgA [Rhodocyclaceae bacterium]